MGALKAAIFRFTTMFQITNRMVYVCVARGLSLKSEKIGFRFETKVVFESPNFFCIQLDLGMLAMDNRPKYDQVWRQNYWT